MLVDQVAITSLERLVKRKPPRREPKVERKADADNNQRQGLKPPFEERRPDQSGSDEPELDRYV